MAGWKVRINEPKPDMYADEPVLARTGPHWVSNDVTLGLFALTIGMLLAAIVFGRTEWAWFALLPVSVLIVRLATDLPRYWHFEVVLTTRRLVLNVGTIRDVYHTIDLHHIQSVEVRQDFLGRVLGYGEVIIELEATSPDGREHRGVYSLDYLRDPRELRDALVSAMEGL